MQTEKEICKKVAKIYAEKDWHKLLPWEECVVALLEESEYILPNQPPNGFVGRANPDK